MSYNADLLNQKLNRVLNNLHFNMLYTTGIVEMFSYENFTLSDDFKFNNYTASHINVTQKLQSYIGIW